MEIEIICDSFAKLPDKYKPMVLNLVGISGVWPRNLVYRMLRAKILVVAVFGANVIGVCGIKRPYKSYLAKLAVISKNPCIGELPHEEIGWLFIVPRWRRKGIARTLMSCALFYRDCAVPVYAVASMSNIGAISLLYDFGFTLIGETFDAIHSKKLTGLFLLGESVKLANAWTSDAI